MINVDYGAGNVAPAKSASKVFEMFCTSMFILALVSSTQYLFASLENPEVLPMSSTQPW